MLFPGENSKMVLFKDKQDINHRNKSAYSENIHQLAKLIKEQSLKALLDDSVLSNGDSHDPHHDGCAGLPNEDSGRLTEKRMCRCMCYYDADTDICKKCSLEAKWYNTGSYEVIDYEVPMMKVVSTVGGIDLVLQGSNNDLYTVEVKPQDSKETLVRMIAEALTYREAGGSERYQNAKPAVCFFRDQSNGEKSAQAKDFLNPNIASDPAFQYLLGLLTVFYITTGNGTDGVIHYSIHNHSEEPLT